MSSRAYAAFTTCVVVVVFQSMCKFREHEYFQAHRDALSAYVASKSLPIRAQLQRRQCKIQSQYRRSLLDQHSLPSSARICSV